MSAVVAAIRYNHVLKRAVAAEAGAVPIREQHRILRGVLRLVLVAKDLHHDAEDEVALVRTETRLLDGKRGLLHGDPRLVHDRGQRTRARLRAFRPLRTPSSA